MNEIMKPTIDLTLDVRIPKMEPIEHNLGVVKAAIIKLNEFYDSLIFTEDDVKDVKKELTRLRALLKNIEDNRKESVKEFKKPIDDFETTSKDIEKLLKGTIESIKSRIEVFKEEDTIKESIKTIKVKGTDEQIEKLKSYAYMIGIINIEEVK
jgi:DNA-binding transcriptional regulator GbsR (MarR family)